jgi:hypothetical protein
MKRAAHDNGVIETRLLQKNGIASLMDYVCFNYICRNREEFGYSPDGPYDH